MIENTKYGSGWGKYNHMCTVCISYLGNNLLCNKGYIPDKNHVHL